MTVKLPRIRDVDRRLVVVVTLSEPGDVSLHGSVLIGSARPVGVFGPLVRDVRANVPVRVKIPISRRTKRLVKRGARHRKLTRLILATNGRDRACFRNNAHSDRQVTLLP